MAALLAVLVFMVYYDIAVWGGGDFLRPQYYDVLEHFIGGVILSGFFIYYSYIRVVDQFPKNFWLAFLMSLSFVTLVAVGWEFFEFESNIIGQAPQNTLPDTMKDLAIGLLGAATASIFLLPKALKKNFS